MKAAIFVTIATFTILGLLTYVYIEHVTQTANSRITKAQLERVMLERDSLEVVVKFKDDSLLVAFNTIRSLSQQKQASDERLRNLNTKHEKIRFTVPANDSVRRSDWARLYPSLRNH